jgi:hypothetical protein
VTLPALNPAGYKYRGLREGLEGWDCFALQTALSIPADGIFGPQTHAAVVAAQQRHALEQDGIAGALTQRALALDLVWPVQSQKGSPPGLLRGQIEHESSFWLGNHSPQYPDGNFDVGVCQRNTRYVDYKGGFNAPVSITALGINLRAYYDEFAGVADRRRWGLAAGAWNAPAFACYLANEDGAEVPKNETLKPSASARQALEAYIAAVTVYVP